MPITPAAMDGRRRLRARAARMRCRALLVSTVAATAAIMLLAAASLASLASTAEGGRVASRGSTTSEALLRTIPNEAVLKRVVLMADLRRLRLAYPKRAALASALAGTWLPDALAAAGSARWPASFGFGLDGIDLVVAAGFHPREVMVAAGRFDSTLVRSKLRSRGYDMAAGVMSRDADGSIDVGTQEGRLTLSGLARVAVSRSRLVAASTTALATSALAPRATLAADPDLVAAGRALESFTSAAIMPASSIRPPSGALYEPLVERHSSLLAVAFDDRGVAQRTLRLALVYRQAADARGDARILARTLSGTRLIDQPAVRFGEILTGLRVKVSGRAIVIGGALAASQGSGGSPLLRRRVSRPARRLVGDRSARRANHLSQLGLPAETSDLQRRSSRARRMSREGTPAVTIKVLFAAEERDAVLRDEVREGLTSAPKELQPKWFYDQRGSALFDEITRIPEYYLTRTERSILERHADEIAGMSGAETLIELGSGTSEKTRLLLDALAPTRFVPFDVSEDALRASAEALRRERPDLEVVGIVGDFERHLSELPVEGRRLLIFLGSTIGNLPPTARAHFLCKVAEALEHDDAFLLGVDLVKSPARLLSAYNDAAGVTRDFNLNVLHVLGRELEADFDIDAFAHVARWNVREEWIEMSVRSLRAQTVRVQALGLEVDFDEGELMRTEISAKFRLDGIIAELSAAGLATGEWWTDPAGDFALLLARPSRSRKTAGLTFARAEEASFGASV